MNTITKITPEFAVAGELAPFDFAEIVALGFKAIINNRPDGEAENQLSAAAEEGIARSHGLQYVHIPASMQNVFSDEVVSAMAEALANLDGPILAHCKSGMRSTILWAAASARTLTIAEVLQRLENCPFDLSFLRDELEHQAERRASIQAT